MGLTIHYSFTAPASLARPKRAAPASVAEVKPLIDRLHAACSKLPFKTVNPVAVFEGAACDYEKCADMRYRWPLIQCMGYVGCDRRVGGRLVVSKKRLAPVSLGVLPEVVVLFSAWPGDGCEYASFGLRLLPRTREYTDGVGDTGTVPVSGGGKWGWSSFCKTCYSKDFVKCHTTVIAALDAASALGFKPKVYDEGGYWECRNEGRLRRSL